MKLRARIAPLLPQLACVATLAGLLLLSSGCKRAEPGTYATPEEAVQALNEIVGTRDNPKTEYTRELMAARPMLYPAGHPVPTQEAGA